MLKVGLTERHGMADEQMLNPPVEVSYEFMDTANGSPFWMTSPIKGFRDCYIDNGFDAVEAVISPIVTDRPWFYSLACYEEAIAFEIFGLPTPKFIRNLMVCRMFKKDNFQSLIFWSEAGRDTLKSYGGFSNTHWIWEKSEVVYPAIKQQDTLVSHEDEVVTILFNGNFFIKGGVNVVDAFESLNNQNKFKLKLRLCCDENIDFEVGDRLLREKYLKKIKDNPDIVLGRVSRAEFVSDILPSTNIYVLPSYGDAFGFAVLEAMSFGIPVVVSDYMALPEMVDDGVEGFHVLLNHYNCKDMFPGCYVASLPKNFTDDVSSQLLSALTKLVESKDLRKTMGAAGAEKVAKKFSFERRNARMIEIYDKYL